MGLNRRSEGARRLRRNPEDRAYVRDLLARLQEFKEKQVLQDKQDLLV